MSQHPARVPDFLQHIVAAIDKVQSYTAGLDEAAFTADSLVQDAVIRNLEIIGEASRNLERHAPGFAELHPELPLGAAYEMRNVLAHGYFQVDLHLVWQTIQHDLPPLRNAVASLLTLPPANA
ncbi:HepT-like ribonuclease domain-containing protein [Roseateles paludis]|jgi:uncharacterized protein with HEPN domain|uniref:DUF86 domain-containing protein n=1 Tax=Roseateles paludis TaxID=3145238 RepID=A0ABV0G6P6_9BURK